VYEERIAAFELALDWQVWTRAGRRRRGKRGYEAKNCEEALGGRGTGRSARDGLGRY